MQTTAGEKTREQPNAALLGESYLTVAQELHLRTKDSEGKNTTTSVCGKLSSSIEESQYLALRLSSNIIKTTSPLQFSLFQNFLFSNMSQHRHKKEQSRNKNRPFLTLSLSTH